MKNISGLHSSKEEKKFETINPIDEKISRIA